VDKWRQVSREIYKVSCGMLDCHLSSKNLISPDDFPLDIRLPQRKQTLVLYIPRVECSSCPGYYFPYERMQRILYLFTSAEWHFRDDEGFCTLLDLRVKVEKWTVLGSL
jgi:hypothetical protein